MVLLNNLELVLVVLNVELLQLLWIQDHTLHGSV